MFVTSQGAKESRWGDRLEVVVVLLDKFDKLNPDGLCSCFMILKTPPSSTYQPQSIDTSVESDAVQFYLLRQRSNAHRAVMASSLTRWARSASLRGMRKANKTAFKDKFAQSILGEKWLPCLTPTSDPSMWIQDPSEIARLLHPIFEQLGIPYYITGGVASSMYGEPRTTRDMDIVIELAREYLLSLVAALENAGFYCPPGAIEDIQDGRSKTFSVTHQETILNADLIVNTGSEFDRSKMARRRLEEIDEAGLLRVWVISPEDLILAKLLWGQKSQSEKQRRDVLGIIKIQGEILDRNYLSQWAQLFSLLEDLEQLYRDGGI